MELRIKNKIEYNIKEKLGENIVETILQNIVQPITIRKYPIVKQVYIDGSSMALESRIMRDRTILADLLV